MLQAIWRENIEYYTSSAACGFAPFSSGPFSAAIRARKRARRRPSVQEPARVAVRHVAVASLPAVSRAFRDGGEQSLVSRLAQAEAARQQAARPLLVLSR